jgi:hypothetical protein
MNSHPEAVRLLYVFLRSDPGDSVNIERFNTELLQALWKEPHSKELIRIKEIFLDFLMNNCNELALRKKLQVHLSSMLDEAERQRL